MNSIRPLFKFSSFIQNISSFRGFSSQGNSTTKASRGIVVGVYDKEKDKEEACIELSPGAFKVDQATGGQVTNALNGLRGDIGKLGKVTILSHLSEEFPAIAVAGMGQKNVAFSDIEYIDEEAENVRIATGVGARHLRDLGVSEVVVEDFNRPEAAAEGSALGVFQYSDKPMDIKVSQFKDDAGSPNNSEEDWLRGLTKAESQNLVRCLCETPPNFITPSLFAQRARDLLCPYGVQVFARDIRWLRENNMEALLTVGSSSIEPPVFLTLRYCSDHPNIHPYVLIGQGTTFNSGGLCVKECSHMMEADYAGAATILGVFKAVAAMRLAINLTAYIPLYEHMLSGLSLKAMDVINCRSTLVQTPHTDDCHQVVLGEAAQYALSQHCPPKLITLGSLSPTIKAFMGGTTAVFARCDETWEHLNYAGAVTGDRMWRLPLFNHFAQQIVEDKSVDVLNLGKNKKGEPCLIAAVLNKLTLPCQDFTYMDITGSSATANGYVPYLAEGFFTGAPTRAIIQLLCHLDYCSKQIEDPTQMESRSGTVAAGPCH